MSDIRADPYSLKSQRKLADPRAEKAFEEADEAFSVLKDDVRQIKIMLTRGSEAVNRTIQTSISESIAVNTEYFTADSLDQASLSLSGAPLVFSFLDSGGHGYNPANGIFTVPTSGVYSLSCSLRVSLSGPDGGVLNQASVSFGFHDGSFSLHTPGVISVWFDGASPAPVTPSDMGSINVVYRLGAGSTISVYSTFSNSGPMSASVVGNFSAAKLGI